MTERVGFRRPFTASKTKTMDTKTNNLKKLAFCSYSAILLTGLCASSASVVVPLLRAQYNLSYSLSGLLLALLSVGNLVAGLLAGILPRYIGRRMTMLLFTAGATVGYGLLALIGWPAILGLGFLLIGLSKGNSMNNVTVNIGIVSAKDKTRGMNLLNAAYATGSLCGPFIYLLFSGDSCPWYMPLIILAIGGALMWIFLFFTKGTLPEDTAGNFQAPGTSDRSAPLPKSSREDWSFLKNRHFWYSVVFLFGQQCAEISVTGWLVTYFKDTDILTGSISEFTVTIIWGAMLISRLIIAFVLKKNSRLRSLSLMSFCCIVTYFMLLLSKTSTPALISLCLFGFSIAGIYPTAIAQAGKNLSSASVGVLLPVAGIGAVIMPYITGAVAAAVGIQGGMMCSMAALVLMFVFSILLKKTEE